MVMVIPSYRFQDNGGKHIFQAKIIEKLLGERQEAQILKFNVPPLHT